MKGLTLDAGALIAFERGSRRVALVIAEAARSGDRVAIPAGAVGQVWRNGRTQTRLARLVKSPCVEIVPLTLARACAAGQLCGRSGTSDVIDASVVLCARERGHGVMTSDREDIARLDPRLKVVKV